MQLLRYMQSPIVGVCVGAQEYVIRACKDFKNFPRKVWEQVCKTVCVCIMQGCINVSIFIVSMDRNPGK